MRSNDADEYAQTLERTVGVQKDMVKMLTYVLTVTIFGPVVTAPSGACCSYLDWY